MERFIPVTFLWARRGVAAAGILLAGLGLAVDPPPPAAPVDSIPPPPPPAPVVEIKTSMGVIRVELNLEKAPVTVANFLGYVSRGYYDGTVFHRAVGGYIIQGGAFEKVGDQLIEKPTDPPIKSEADNALRNLEGTIAMARTDVPDSATSQFFINVRDNDILDQSLAAPGFTVFGRVTAGMDVVRQINDVQTGVRQVTRRLGDHQQNSQSLKAVPLQDVVIESIRVLTPATPPT